MKMILCLLAALLLTAGCSCCVEKEEMFGEVTQCWSYRTTDTVSDGFIMMPNGSGGFIYIPQSKTINVTRYAIKVLVEDMVLQFSRFRHQVTEGTEVRVRVERSYDKETDELKETNWYFVEFVEQQDE